MERIRETFNDGHLKIRMQVTKRNELRKKIGTSYENVAGPLRFRNLSLRESDIATMNAMDSKLSKKVKTPFHPIAKNFQTDKYFVVIEELRFNVIYVDYDKHYLYFYLEKVGETDGNNESEGENTAL